MLASLSGSVRRVRERHGFALLGLGLVVYFGYHAVSGDRSLWAWRQLTAEIAATRQELAEVRAERLNLEDKVKRLRPESLDPDLVDELARKRLSFVDPLDVIILLDAGRERK
jgi:cell division protein FtsB